MSHLLFLIFHREGIAVNDDSSEGGTVLTKRERLKNHWQRNKKIYIAAGIGVAVGLGVGMATTKYVQYVRVVGKHERFGVRLISAIRAKNLYYNGKNPIFPDSTSPGRQAIQRAAGQQDVAGTRVLSFLSKVDASTTIGDTYQTVQTTHTGRRGSPGYKTECIETGDNARTQLALAKKMGISPTLLSAHLNGKFPDVNGLHFRRIPA